MDSAVLVFPGSNCDRDMAVALESVTGRTPIMVWHKETDLPKVDVIAIPGGFSYGDYLRCGAMAAQSPIMPALAGAARAGMPILGVCNGFQILTESGLLPGALMRNGKLKFVCRDVKLTVTAGDSRFTAGYGRGSAIHLPVAHHDGNFVADDDTLDRLEGDDRVAFTYSDDINGSARRIAGILSENRRILGMMPHPERAVDPLHGGTHGRALFESLLG